MLSGRGAESKPVAHPCRGPGGQAGVTSSGRVTPPRHTFNVSGLSTSAGIVGDRTRFDMPYVAITWMNAITSQICVHLQLALQVFRAVGVTWFAVNCFSATTYGGRLAILFTGRKPLRSSDLR